ncbi:Cas4 family exonuclease [Microbacterium phage Count]|nr:Cas4 family exonuclease [Microbacterium phage Count]
MKFNSHPELVGKHAFLSPSGYHWIRYTDDKILDRLETSMSAQHGTRLHEIAAELINLGINLPKTQTTLNMYVNDAIGFRMSPEVSLMASYNAFGTADAISFRKERVKDKVMTLRIHDLKNGVHPAKMDQLKIYAAYFCIEYAVNPNDIHVELRIYQNDDFSFTNSIEDPDLGADILTIMGRTLHFDKLITDRRLEVLG